MSIDLLRPTYVDLRYFGANRFFSNEGFKDFNRQKINCDEIVSFDCCLFEMYELACPDADLSPGTEQIVAVIISPEVEPLEHLGRKGFTFCGYDLVERTTLISSITNCGAEFSSVPYDKLTEYGLLPTYKDAVLTQLALVEEYPDEHHAYCVVCEIWRKLV